MPINPGFSATDNLFSMNRKSYYKTVERNPLIENASTNNGKKEPAYLLRPLYTSNNCQLGSCGKPIQTSYSYSASSYIEAKKRNAIGISSKGQQNKPLAFSNINKNDPKHARQYVRNIGYAAPAKKTMKHLF